MERRQSQPSHRVRAADGKVLLALGAVGQSDACRPHDLHSRYAYPAQPLETAWLRVDAGAGAWQGDLRAECGQVRQAGRGIQPMLLLSQRAQGDQSKAV